MAEKETGADTELTGWEDQTIPGAEKEDILVAIVVMGLSAIASTTNMLPCCGYAFTNDCVVDVGTSVKEKKPGGGRI